MILILKHRVEHVIPSQTKPRKQQLLQERYPESDDDRVLKVDEVMAKDRHSWRSRPATSRGKKVRAPFAFKRSIWLTVLRMKLFNKPQPTSI